MRALLIVLIYEVAMVSSSTKHHNRNHGIRCDEENRIKANACAEKLWFVGRNSRKYPENEAQMQKYCKQTANFIKCVKDYTDQCGKETQKHLAHMMLYYLKINQKSYCTKSAKREEVISLSSCANSLRGESSACMDRFMNDLGKSNGVEFKYKIPEACCAFHDLKECIMTSARNASKITCGEKICENWEKYINAMAGNTLNLLCSQYEADFSKCKKLPSLPKSTNISKPPSIIVGVGLLLADD